MLGHQKRLPEKVNRSVFFKRLRRLQRFDCIFSFDRSVELDHFPPADERPPEPVQDAIRGQCVVKFAAIVQQSSYEIRMRHRLLKKCKNYQLRNPAFTVQANDAHPQSMTNKFFDCKYIS